MEEEVASSSDDLYWKRTESVESVGIVAAVSFMFGNAKNFKAYSSFYNLSGWDCVVCHPQLVNLWLPRFARSMAVRVLDELVKEVEKKPRAIVFATFSGGAKACLYKILQVLQGRCEGVDCDKYRIVRAYYAGQIHDSSPVDFVAEVGTNFFMSLNVPKNKKPCFLVTSAWRAAGKVADFLGQSAFGTESQRADYWDTLHRSVDMGPVLILCSEDDTLASIDVIKEFYTQMSMGSWKVTLVIWEKSKHVGHLREHRDEYTAAVKAFLDEAFLLIACRKGHLLTNQQPLPSDSKQHSDAANSLNENFSRSVDVGNMLPQFSGRTDFEDASPKVYSRL